MHWPLELNSESSLILHVCGLSDYLHGAWVEVGALLSSQCKIRTLNCSHVQTTELKRSLLTTSENFTIARNKEQEGMKNTFRLLNYSSRLQACKKWSPPLSYMLILRYISVLGGDKGPVLLCSWKNRNSRSLCWFLRQPQSGNRNIAAWLEVNIWLTWLQSVLYREVLWHLTRLKEKNSTGKTLTCLLYNSVEDKLPISCHPKQPRSGKVEKIREYDTWWWKLFITN